MIDQVQLLRDYLRDIEEYRLPELREWLGPLEKGEMRLGERIGNGEWIDTTQREIDRAKRSIVEYETIAENLKKRIGV
jgi:putative hemolysin